MLKIIRINFLVFVGMLLFLEISGQIISFIKNKQFLFDDHEIRARHELFRPHPYLSVALKKNINLTFQTGSEYHTVKTTELGTRWTGADLKDTSLIRIACIGGSTTFCTGVKDEDTWPAILQRKLGRQYAVINFGVPAYNSVEAIIQLALFVPEVKPDIIVMYMGANDLYNYYQENSYPDYYRHGEELMPLSLLGTAKYESGFEKISRRSGFFYIAHNIEKMIYPAEIPKHHTLPDTTVDRLYIRNLNSMLALSSCMKSKKILIGQVLNPFFKRADKPWSMRIKSGMVIPMMNRMNEIACSTCENDSTCTYLDFANKLHLKPDHFWDDMHFTKSGNELFAGALKKAILNETPYVDIDHAYVLNVP